MNRVTEEDEAKIQLVNLLISLCETRHFCVEVLKQPKLMENVSFLSIVAPDDSVLKKAAQDLFARLSMTRVLLQGTSPGGRPVSDRCFNTVNAPNAPELHAMRANKARDLSASSPSKLQAQMGTLGHSFSALGRSLPKGAPISSFDRVI